MKNLKNPLFLLFLAFFCLACLILILTKIEAVPISAPPHSPFADEVKQAKNALPDRLFGLTIDESSFNEPRLIEQIIEELKLIKASKPENPPPTVRIVLPVECGKEDDKGNCKEYDTDKLDDKFVDLIKRLKAENLAFVMAEIMDSTKEISSRCFKALNIEKSVKCYLSRTESFYDKLGDNVDIWEVGNEINGEWFGGDHKNQAKRRKIVVRQVSAALNRIKEKNAKAAVTYYFNGYKNKCRNYDDENDSMMKWITNKGRHFEDQKINFANADYVLISYYPDDNCYETDSASDRELSAADWKEIFQEISKSYGAETKFGLGEMGTHCKFKNCKDSDSCEIIKTEYNCCRSSDCCPQAQIDVFKDDYIRLDNEIRAELKKYEWGNRFTGGYFYWFYSPDVINKAAYGNDGEKKQAENVRNAVTEVFRHWK